MTLLHNAYTALLSGLTHRTGKEIHWHDEDGYPITVEPVDVERESCVVRYYGNDSSLCIEKNYLQDQLHGKSTYWYCKGQKQYELNYHYNQRHNKSMSWYENGQLKWELNYVSGQLHGKYIWWYPNGQLRWVTGYNQDQRHGQCTMWREDGTLRGEDYYINGRKATREQWEQHNEPTT